MKMLLTFSIVVLVFLLNGCGRSDSIPSVPSISSGTEVVGGTTSQLPIVEDRALSREAIRVFEEKVNRDRTPYRNEQYYLQSNDGDYATILVIADIRYGQESNYLQQQGSIKCNNVGGNWECAAVFQWSDGPDLLAAKQKSIAIATQNASSRSVSLQDLKIEYAYPPIVTADGDNLVVPIDLSVTNLGDAQLRFCPEVSASLFRVSDNYAQKEFKTLASWPPVECDHSLMPGERKNIRRDLKFGFYEGVAVGEGTEYYICDVAVGVMPVQTKEDWQGKSSSSPEFNNTVILVDEPGCVGK